MNTNCAQPLYKCEQLLTCLFLRSVNSSSVTLHHIDESDYTKRSLGTTVSISSLLYVVGGNTHRFHHGFSIRSMFDCVLWFSVIVKTTVRALPGIHALSSIHPGVFTYRQEGKRKDKYSYIVDGFSC